MNKFKHLNLPDGITNPYRPKPRDFREVYVRIGWDGIEDHFNTNWRVIRRWIEEEGREDLKAERREYVAAKRKHNRENRSKPFRYVMGQRLGGNRKAKKKRE